MMIANIMRVTLGVLGIAMVIAGLIAAGLPVLVILSGIALLAFAGEL